METKRTDSSFSQRDTKTVAERVVIAVRAEKVISKNALAWTLTHVVHHGRRFWNFPILTGNCKSNQTEKLPDQICQIPESCSQMVLQLRNQIEVRVRIKVVSGTPGSAVATEARNNGANWVVLDKKLKQELKHCLAELHCSIVAMKNSKAKVLRLNLQSLNENQTKYFSATASPVMDVGELQGSRMKHSTPVSSPESTSSTRTNQQGLLSNSDIASSLFHISEQNPLFERVNRSFYTQIDNQNQMDVQLMARNSHMKTRITLPTNPTASVATNRQSIYWIPQNHTQKIPKTKNYKYPNKSRSPRSRTLLDKFTEYDQDARVARLEFNQGHHKSYGSNSSVRDAVPLRRTYSIPPPLCSLCQHKAPIFGKPPTRFSYKELEEATDGFSNMNFLAEGSFGIVYRGELRDGQVVAVKLLTFGSSQVDADFCREVRVLSCAQHRNVVLLIGFCIDSKRRVLVYEYICNGSLDSHLHGNKRIPLDWQSRLKIATGAARGLRYLHEDCRVGSIVHRDMRPNNILLTHDFEPLVTDFGLARWHTEWNINSEERAVGTSGYLAPEYIDDGKITQKVDVYAFGVVLLEIMTGQRTRELQCYKQQHVLSEWLHPLASLEPGLILEKIYCLIDPYLTSEQAQNFAYQLQAMACAAFLCLSQDPESRPSMSKVLRILEGGDAVIPLALDLNSVGNRSGHLPGLSSQVQTEARKSHCRRLSH